MNLKKNMYNFQFYSPVKILFGVGISLQVDEVCKNFGKRALIVTTAGTNRRSSLIRSIQKQLKAVNIYSYIYEGVMPETTVEMVEEGASLGKKLRVDLILGVGGGSSIDTAKGIATLIPTKGRFLDYVLPEYGGKLPVIEKALPVIAIPTTSGTGSEVTNSGVIKDKKKKIKKVIASPFLFPKVSMIDPQLMISMPKEVTINSGMDALIQAMEAYTSNRTNPISDTIALKAISLIRENLLKVVKNGKDIKARSGMALGSTLAGIAISQAGVGACHAIAMGMGGYYSIPHGLALIMIYPEVMKINLIQVKERYFDIAKALGEEVDHLSLLEGAKRCIKHIEALREKLKINFRLSRFEVQKKDIDKLIINSNNPDMSCNLKKLSNNEIQKILISRL